MLLFVARLTDEPLDGHMMKSLDTRQTLYNIIRKSQSCAEPCVSFTLFSPNRISAANPRPFPSHLPLPCVRKHLSTKHSLIITRYFLPDFRSNTLLTSLSSINHPLKHQRRRWASGMLSPSHRQVPSTKIGGDHGCTCYTSTYKEFELEY